VRVSMCDVKDPRRSGVFVHVKAVRPAAVPARVTVHVACQAASCWPTASGKRAWMRKRMRLT
jgi:hypothetical protein